MKTTLLFLLLSSSLSIAQTTIMFQDGIGSRTPLIPLHNHNSLEDSWKSANLVSLGIDHFITGSIAIMSGIEYNSYAFGEYTGVTPDDATSNYDGDATHIYRISVEGKFVNPPNRNFTFYIVAGLCYNIEHIGIIRLNGWSPISTYQTPKQSKYYWMQTIGIGERWSFFDRFGADLTGRLYTDYSAHFHESLVLGFFYIL